MIKQFSRKKKLTSIIALLALTLMLFTGCVRSGVGVMIKEDDTGTVEISMGINEEFYDSLVEQLGGEDVFEGKSTTKITDGDDTYICYVEHKDFKNLEDLEKILLEVKYDFGSLNADDSETNVADDLDSDDDLWLDDDDSEDADVPSVEEETVQDLRIFKSAEVTHTSDFFGDQYYFTVTTNPQKTQEDESAIEIPGMTGDDMFKLVVAVTMPGTISSESGVVNENTVSFTLNNLEEETVLTAESSSTNIAGIIGLAIAVILLIVVLVLVFGKKKPQNHTFD